MHSNHQFASAGARVPGRKDWVAMATGLLVLQTACVVRAQDAPAAGSPPSAASTQNPSSQSESVLQEVIVTANRRAQNIQNVPITISAVTASQLSNANISSTAGLATLVPGLNIDQGIASFAPFIRGVGTAAVNPAGDNSVQTYVDGVLISDFNAGLLSLNDVKEVEVDKGPQGTLFGRNTTGGVINITTRTPSHELHSDSTISYGNFQTISADEYLTGGLGKYVAASLSAYYSDQGQGWGRNLATGADVHKSNTRAVRVKLLFTPTDRDKITVAGDYNLMSSSIFGEEIVPGTYTNWGPGTTTAAQRPDMAGFIASGAVTPGFIVGQPATHDPGSIYDVDTLVNPMQRWWQWGESLTWEHEFGDFNVRYIGASRDYRMDNIWPPNPVPTPQQVAGWGTGTSELTQELQVLSAPSSPIQWVGGVFFLHNTVKYLSPFFIEGTSISGTNGGAPFSRINFTGEQSTISYAPYGQVTAPLPFLGATDLTLGVRYTHDVKDLSGGGIFFDIAAPGSAPYLGFLPPPGPIFDVPEVIAGQGTFIRTTYRVALDHRFTDDVLGYVSYNTGFKSGGFNMIPPSSPAYQPEYLDAWEVGAKTEFLNHRVRWNTSAFLYKWTNMQVTVFQNTSAVTANAAQARMYGLDSDVQALVTDQLTVSAGIEALKGYFSSYDDAEFNPPQTAAEGGGTLATVGNATGHSLPFTPDVTFNLTGSYKIPLPIGQLALDGTYYYNSGFKTTADNYLGQGRYGLLSAKVKWQLPDGHTALSLWGDNLTNRVYANQVRNGGNPGGYVVETLGAPRTYGVSLQYDY